MTELLAEYLMCTESDNSIQDEDESHAIDLDHSSGVYLKTVLTTLNTTITEIEINHDPESPYIVLSPGVQLCGIIYLSIESLILIELSAWNRLERSPQDEFSDYQLCDVFASNDWENGKQYIVGKSKYFCCEEVKISYSRSDLKKAKERGLRKWNSRVTAGRASYLDIPDVELFDTSLSSYSDFQSPPWDHRLEFQIVFETLFLEGATAPILMKVFDQVYVNRDVIDKLHSSSLNGIEVYGGIRFVHTVSPKARKTGFLGWLLKR
ncbi:MAG: hypothetical protein ACI861_000767 [Paracoccaceae bacterium]|jgi:hypothetical protein